MKCLYCNVSIVESGGHKWKIKGRKYCSHKCQMEYQYRQRILEWKSGVWDGNGVKGFDTSSVIRRYLTEKYGNKCAQCG